ncbi:MAG: OprO/OprP family phosphate-selective porin [Planctomycetota bacterium]
MEKQSINVLGKLVFFAIVFGLFTPVVAQAEQDADVRIEKLETQLRAMQTELEILKAQQARAAREAAPAVDKKQVKTMVDKILAEKPRPELGPSDFRVFWKEGLRLETPDKDFTLKIGGRIMNDWGWMRQDSAVKSSKGNLLDGTEFRRARLYISGLIYGNVDYKLQFDFANGSAVLKDAFLGIRDLPIGYLKMGHFKEPFGLEELTSSKYITFLERALPAAFAPSRNTGFMLSSTAYDKRMTWAAGVFRDTGSTGSGTSEGGYNVTGRITALPWYENDGAKLLHVGVAYSLRDPTSTEQYKSAPEAHLAPYFVDTTAFTANTTCLLGLESALVYGPFSVQGEYMRADADRSGSPSATFDGFYIQGSYFLTGEYRKYSTSKGAFDRVKPKENFTYGAGLGAWEVATRYSQIDLSDNGISGGKLKDITVGLNWYLNPNMRVMWNYIHAKLDGVGDSDLALMRLQIDF